jgi:cytochrome c5
MRCLLFWAFMIPAAFSASHHPQEFLSSIEHEPHVSEKIYQHFCQNCHAEHPLIPVGAPRISDSKAWQERERKGRKQILQHTLEGYRLMPARGGCFECSDAQLEAVVDWMMSKK